jgi:CubicO group peptidase (beta-lactamase class C family)
LGALQLEDGLFFRASNRRMSGSVRDFARIAWFWLNRGKWQGREVLPQRYFDDWMRPQVPKDLPLTIKAETNDYLKIASYGGGSDHFTTAGAGIYGFNWWFNDTGRSHPDQRTWPDAPPDTVMSLGFAGNSSAIMPSLNLAVACLSGDWGQLQPGQRDSAMNQRLKLIAAAGRPAEGCSPGCP